MWVVIIRTRNKANAMGNYKKNKKKREGGTDRRRAHFFVWDSSFPAHMPIYKWIHTKYSLSPVETWWAVKKGQKILWKIRAKNRKLNKYQFYGHSLEFEIMRIESKRRIRHVSFHVNTPKHVTHDMLIEFSRFFVSFCEFCLPNDGNERKKTNTIFEMKITSKKKKNKLFSDILATNLIRWMWVGC